MRIWAKGQVSHSSFERRILSSSIGQTTLQSLAIRAWQWVDSQVKGVGVKG